MIGPIISVKRYGPTNQIEFSIITFKNSIVYQARNSTKKFSNINEILPKSTDTSWNSGCTNPSTVVCGTIVISALNY